MLDAGRCTIYEARPQTCLDFDCRIFAAAGIDAGQADKAVINRRVREWRFDYPTAEDEAAHRAVKATASFIRERRASFAVPVPSAPMGIAVLAIKSCEVFMRPGPGVRDDAEIAEAIVGAARHFDRG